MTLLRRILLLGLCVMCLSPLQIQYVLADGCDTTSDVMLVSVKTGGDPATQLASGNDVSDDGRYIVFRSYDSTIVPNDTNNTADIFLHDRETCITHLVTRSMDGNPATGGLAEGTGSEIRISGDGRYVLFDSNHLDMVAGDKREFHVVYLYDHHTQTVEQITTGSANGSSHISDISKDGRFIVFASDATNMIPNDTNNATDTFLFDRQSNTLERVSVSSEEEQGNRFSWYGEVSDDGRFVVFISTATNFTTLDTSTHQKVFLRDRQNGTTTLISLTENEEPANDNVPYAFISNNGRYVGMTTSATNFVNSHENIYNGYVRDLQTGTVTWVTPSDEPVTWTYAGSFSGDGRYVAIEISGNHPVNSYLYDMQTGVTTLQSRTPSGEPFDGASILPVLTADARYMLFSFAELEAENRGIYLARVALPSGSLDMTVGLQGRPTAPHPDWVASVRVVIVPQGSTTPVYDEIVTTDDSGAFAIPDLNYGIYSVWVKGTNTLAVSQTITLAAESLSVPVELLLAGDANGDNVVSLADFSILASSFGTQSGDPGYDARADFNGDDLITLPDFSLLATNYNSTGAPLP